METIDLNLDNLDPVSIDLNHNSSSSAPSVNFGSGIELLMNDKKRSSSSDNIKLDLGDLDTLEQEMNDLSSTATSAVKEQNSGENKTLSNMASNLFGMGGFTEPDIEINISFYPCRVTRSYVYRG